MRFREGTTGQKALFGALVGTYVLGLALLVVHASARVGRPHPGVTWLFHMMFAATPDAAEAGVAWGSRPLRVNGVEVAGLTHDDILALERREPGTANALTIHRPDGEIVDVVLPVRTYTWADAVYYNWLQVSMGAVFFLVGLTTFLLRPYEPSSWAVFMVGIVGGAVSTTCLLSTAEAHPVFGFYCWTWFGMAIGAFAHLGLAFPTPHPVLVRRPRIVSGLYAACIPLGGFTVWAVYTPRPLESWPLLIAGIYSFGVPPVVLAGIRCVVLGLRSRNRLVRQRAWIILAAVGPGLGLNLVLTLVAIAYHGWLADWRLTWIPMSFTPLPLAYLTLRYDLVNAQIAVRRAVVYVLAIGAVVAVVWLGGVVSPVVSAGLLLPVLYVWPRFNTRVNGWLYPRRAQFSGLHRAIGDELAASATREAVVDVLAAVPLRVCETDSGAAFLLPGAAGDRERVSGAGETNVAALDGLADEPLVQMLVVSRQTIKRESLGVDPQFALIKDAARACMDSLNAAVLLPIERDGRVIGGLAVGPHVRGDVYDPAELELLRTLAHDAVHALAMAELREQSTPGGRPRTPTASAFSPGAGDSLDFSESASGYVLPAVAGDRYEVRELLGEGGFKRVYLAHDAMLDRDVALAVIRSHALDAEGRKRVRREARAMAQLGDHPHLVTVYDMGETADELYIVSQYMPGGDLDTKLAEAPGLRLPVEEAVRIGQDLCTALAEAHGHGILHRDLKPGNVWFQADGGAALGDFGLALSVDQSRITQSGYLVGTMAYMAPEIYQGAAPSVQSDLYALSVLLYEMVAGRRPHHGDSTAAIMHAHVHGVPEPPSVYNPDVPPALDTVILRLLAKDPRDRYDDAHAVSDALAAVVARPEERTPPPAPVQPGAGALRRRWQAFVGRAPELERLKAGVDAACGGRATVLMLVGEPGIGKTRTAEEVAAYAAERGARVLVGRCYEGEGAPPYWPWVQIIREYVQARAPEDLRRELGPGGPDIAQVVSAVRERLPDLEEPPQLDGEAARWRLFDSVTMFLRNASRSQPLVLLIDDLHWADGSSLGLVQFLAREIGDARVLLLGTYRDVELDRTHPLAEVLGELRRERLYERVALGGFAVDEVVALMEAMADHELDAAGRALAAAIHLETEGNPFFVEETILHLQETGRIYQDAEGRWVGRERVEDMGLPEGVREVVGRRLARRSDECNAVLTIAAVTGREFEQAVVEPVSELEGGALVSALEEAEDAGLIAEVPGRVGRYRFTHALIRETLYEELRTPRRVQLHRRVGEALEERHAANIDPYLAELAHHFGEGALGGGDVAKAIDYAVRAAERATDQTAYDDAAAHYERALQVQELQEPVEETQRCELLLALGRTLGDAGDPERAQETVLQVIHLARELPAPKMFARAVIELSTFHWQIGAVDEEMLRLGDEALALLPEEDSMERASLLAGSSAYLMYVKNMGERRDALSAEALEMARRIDSPQALHFALQSQLLCLDRNPLEAIALVPEMIANAERARRPVWMCWALSYRAGSCMTLGDITAADADAAAMRRLADTYRLPFMLHMVEIFKNTRALMDGRFEEAESSARNALTYGRQYRRVAASQVFLFKMGILRWCQGRMDEVQDDLLRHVETHPGEPIGRALQALAHACAGRRPEAQAALDVLSVGDLPEGVRTFDAPFFLGLLTEASVLLGDARRASVLYDELCPYAGRLAMVWTNIVCSGPADHWLGLLAATLERWDAAEEHFTAALETNERIGARPFLARTRCAYAQMLLKRGVASDRDTARELLEQAAGTAEELGMAPLLTESRAALEELEAPPPAPRAEDPFVGREAEWARALPVVRTALGGRGKVLLLVGEPGIGKTRLATETAATAEQLGARVLWGRAYEGEGAPAFWPWVQILREYVEHRDEDCLRDELAAGAVHVAQLVPEVRERLPDLGEPPTVEGADAQFLLFDAVTRFLKRAAGAQPLVLVLEDLHWADASSLLLVHFLARELADAPLLIVGTYRDVEVDKDHPLAEVLGQLVREPVSERLHLGGLSTQAVAELVEATGTETGDANLADAVYEHTEGNPFYIKETLRHLADTGESIADMHVPEGVRDVIRLRLARLPEACRDLLTIGAVVGRDFERSLLGSVSEVAEGDLLDTAVAATHAGLIEERAHRPGQYRFVHALIRETLYEDLAPSRRAQLHLQVGEALETLHAADPEPHLAALAHHFTEALPAGAGAEKAIDYCVRTAERATAQHAYDDAVRHYNRALVLVESQKPVDEQRRCDVMLRLGYALVAAGDPERAEDVLSRTAELALELRAWRLFVDALYQLVQTRLAVYVFDEELLRLAEAGLTRLPDEDSAERAELLAAASRILIFNDSAYDRRVALTERAHEMARRVGDERALVHTLLARVRLWARPLEDKLADANELVRLAGEGRQPEAQAWGLFYRHHYHLEQGNIVAAKADMKAIKRLAQDLPLPPFRWNALLVHAVHTLLTGPLDEAERLALAAFGQGQHYRARNASQYLMAYMFWVRWFQGRLPEIKDALFEQAEQFADAPPYLAARALVHLALGEEKQTHDNLDRLAAHDFAALSRENINSLMAAATATEVVTALADLPRATILYDLLEPYSERLLMLGLNNVCLGALAHWLGLLAATLERWDAAEEHFAAALETNERIGARPWLARTRCAYAQMLLKRGVPSDRDTAREFLQQAAATAEELGMAPLLAESRAALETATAESSS